MMETITIKDFCSILTSDDLYSELIKYIVNNDLICGEVAKDIIYRRCGVINDSIETDKLIKSLANRLSTFISNLKDNGNIEKPKMNSNKIVEENSSENDKMEFETFIRTTGRSNESFYMSIPVDFARQHNLKKNERAIINIKILN